MGAKITALKKIQHLFRINNECVRHSENLRCSEFTLSSRKSAVTGPRARILRMLLESVAAHNFRNLSGGIDCRDGLNILFGENGQGKTNWLEAIAVLASARSFRTARLHEATRFGEASASVSGKVRESPEIVRELRVVIECRTKTLTINDKKEPITRYFGHLHAVLFNSDELDVVRGTPEARRRFLDAG